MSNMMSRHTVNRLANDLGLTSEFAEDIYLMQREVAAVTGLSTGDGRVEDTDIYDESDVMMAIEQEVYGCFPLERVESKDKFIRRVYDAFFIEMTH
jgi:hypothetical protein